RGGRRPRRGRAAPRGGGAFLAPTLVAPVPVLHRPFPLDAPRRDGVKGCRVARRRASGHPPRLTQHFKRNAEPRLGPKPLPKVSAEEATMNHLRTAVLLAGLTALFMGVGYLIGGGSGAMIALLVAAGMNLASYWNADKLVLAMHDAHEVDETTAPDL